MNPRRIRRRAGTVARYGLACLASTFLFACSSIPSATPEAIGLAADRVELNAVAAHTALDNAIVNAGIAKKQAAAAGELLRELDAKKLSEADQKKFNTALGLVEDAAKGDILESVKSVRDEIKPRLNGTASSLRQIQGILADKVGQAQLVNSIVDKLQDSVSEEEEK